MLPQEVLDWVKDPVGVDKPARPLLADAVRTTARALAANAPGRAVEIRVPPFVAVQCIDGPAHTRGTPPNVFETDPLTWLQLATGQILIDDALRTGRLDASGPRVGEVGAFLPIISV
ncbi:MAG: sterol carrier family protein [Corynebacterium sp.]|uniref:sterol carrier family protein n=1 Tax=Corynebacterium sp. TaxID=1720 RepID=UPI0026E00B60|nr:sterol carrier family protein [Corynebacterium sp.]MDO5670564.1 sterol carrier family protein [Corynebacterium sp.]